MLIPLALAGAGVFRTFSLSGHTRTQLALVPRFLDVEMRVVNEPSGTTRVEVGAA